MHARRTPLSRGVNGHARRAVALGVLLMVVACDSAAGGEWVKFASPAGRYSVLFPAATTETMQSGVRDDGTSVHARMAFCQTPSAGYGVGWFDEPADLQSFGGVDGAFDFYVRGALERSQLSETSVRRHLSLDGAVGRTFEGVRVTE